MATDEDGAPKKKRKKEGPGVTAKNMSEEVRKKMSNAAASHAAGLSTGKYSWMHAGNIQVHQKGKEHLLPLEEQHRLLPRMPTRLPQLQLQVKDGSGTIREGEEFDGVYEGES